MKKNKSENIQRITISVPKTLLDTIDQLTENAAVSRTKWFINAALEKVEYEKKFSIDRIVFKC